MKKAFIICTVRGATEEYKQKLEDYIKILENKGYKVHLPHRDTNQESRGLDICMENAIAIKESDEVHIFYNGRSQGSHFDMGVAFAFGKPMTIVENEELPIGKSFPLMLVEWETTASSQWTGVYFQKLIAPIEEKVK